MNFNAPNQYDYKKWAEQHIRFKTWNKNQGSGYCPFHEDNTPSFSMNSKTGQWKCHAGCGHGGIILLAEKLNVKPPSGNGKLHSPAEEKKTIYQYKDKSGNLLFEVVRTDTAKGKKILQRRPDNSGGHIWDLEGIRPVPYRLPELLKSQEEGTKCIFIVEGEKCVEILRSLNFTVTTNSGGAGKWKDEYCLYFDSETEIIIIPDADQPGIEHAHYIASNLQVRGCKVKIIDLGYTVKDKKGDDIYDWLTRDNNSKSDLIELISDTPYLNHKEPETALIDTEKLEFPLTAMPEKLIPFIDKSSESLGCFPDIIAVPMLSILGAAIGNNVTFEIQHGWNEKPNLFTAVISPPGSRKTPALKLVIKPLKEKQENDRKEYEEKVRISQKAYKQWQIRKRKAINKGDNFSEPEPKLLSLKNNPLYYVTDATTEALTVCLQFNRRGFIGIYDELTSLITSMNQYKGGKGNDRQWILKAWSNSPITLIRKGRVKEGGIQVINIPDNCISLTGGIQPSEISMLIGKKSGDSSDGFAQRFLFAYPDFCPSFYKESEGIPIQLEIEYHELLNKVFEFGSQKRALKMTPKAKVLWKKYCDKITHEILKGNLLKAEEEAWHKMISQLARIALIIHVCRSVSEKNVSEDIDETSLTKAWLLVEYFKANLRKVYRDSNNQNRTNKFHKVIEILMNEPGNTATARRIQRSSSTLGNSQAVKMILKMMIDKGILREVKLKSTTVYTLTESFIQSGTY